MSGKESWKNEATRLGGEALVGKINEIANSQKEIVDMMNNFEKRHQKHEAAIEKLFRAFPDGDTEGHRRYHELMIENISEKRRLRVAIQEKTISGLIWSGLVGIALIVWNYFINLIKTGGGFGH